MPNTGKMAFSCSFFEHPLKKNGKTKFFNKKMPFFDQKRNFFDKKITLSHYLLEKIKNLCSLKNGSFFKKEWTVLV